MLSSAIPSAETRVYSMILRPIAEPLPSRPVISRPTSSLGPLVGLLCAIAAPLCSKPSADGRTARGLAVREERRSWLAARHERFLEGGRGCSEMVVERPGEMALAREADGEGHVGDFLLAAGQQVSGALEARL